MFTKLGMCTDALLQLADQGTPSTSTLDTDRSKTPPLTKEAKEIIASCSIEAPTEHKTVKDSDREKEDNALTNRNNSNSKEGKKDAKEDIKGTVI